MSFLLGISALELAAWLAPVQLRGETDLRGKISMKHVTDLDSSKRALACLVLQCLSPKLEYVCKSTQSLLTLILTDCTLV